MPGPIYRFPCLVLAGVVLLASPWRLCAAAQAPAGCLDRPAALAFWRPVRERAGDAPQDADALAPALVDCLGSPDPELRDRIGYELFTDWLRSGALHDDTRRALLRRLSANLSDAAADRVLARSFSALVLAELMRSDASDPFMSAAERQSLLDSAAAALAAESDYRGLTATEGWVHPVAHLSDLLWRFALHSRATPADGARILDAVRAKVAPPGVSYAFNESDRLARAASVVIARQLVDAGQVQAWLRSFERPRHMAAWRDAFASPAGMAELHDTKLFLRALSDQLADSALDPAIKAVLDELVRDFTGLV